MGRVFADRNFVARRMHFHAIGVVKAAVPMGRPGVAAIQRLPTDSVGTFALTLRGMVVGSVIQIETQAGSPIENRAAAGTKEVFFVPAYSIGSSSNDLRIKVRKGTSAPFYQPFETLATAIVGAQSIFVSQIPD